MLVVKLVENWSIITTPKFVSATEKITPERPEIAGVLHAGSGTSMVVW